jgi:hypothetical protein
VNQRGATDIRNSLWNLLLALTACCQYTQKVKITLRSTVSKTLSWFQAPIWDPPPIFPFLSLIIFRQLRVCWCGAPSLTGCQVCSFSFCRASPAQPLSVLCPMGLMIIFYCLFFWTPPPPHLEGQVLVFISPRVAQLDPRTLGSHSIKIAKAI